MQEKVASQGQLPNVFRQAEVYDVLVEVHVAHMQQGVLLKHEHVVLETLLSSLGHFGRKLFFHMLFGTFHNQSPKLLNTF